jgi:anti-sigma factor RsiW
VKRLIHAFVDGELELARQLEVEAALAGDAHLRDEVEALRALRETLRKQADYHAAPLALQQRIRAAAGASRPAPPPVPQRRPWRWRPMLGSAFTAGVAAWLVVSALNVQRQDERVWQDAVTSHVRASLSQHVVDVASSDRHTVKPWLSSRLDYSPPVHDVALPDVVFLGGRVDVLDGRPVAVLAYRMRAHAIDVFVAPSTESERGIARTAQRGFQVVQLVHDGMHYWIVSDVNPDELSTFAKALVAASR